ncbi:MAG: TonB family protein [Smithella sp.]
MSSKKVIYWPVIISIVGHVALLSASGMIDLRDKIRTPEMFTVDIKDIQPDKLLKEEPPKEEKKQKEEAKVEKKQEKKEIKKTTDSKTPKEAKSVSASGIREDTVDLGSSDAKYVAYLNKIKRKILQIWEYPVKAYERNEEGVSVVKMSLDARGNVIATNLVTSSGSTLLDDGSLGIVRAAAPFEPLPNNYGLERLHIVASFRYKLEE